MPAQPGNYPRKALAHLGAYCSEVTITPDIQELTERDEKTGLWCQMGLASYPGPTTFYLREVGSCLKAPNFCFLIYEMETLQLPYKIAVKI